MEGETVMNYSKHAVLIALMCSMVSASAEWAPIKCGQAKFYLSGLIELEERLYRERGLWSCGVPELNARLAVEQACERLPSEESVFRE